MTHNSTIPIGYHHSDNSTQNIGYNLEGLKMTRDEWWYEVCNEKHGYCNLSVGDKINLELPITGKDHDNEQIDTIYEGDFLVTQLRHDFDQSERQHRMLMSVVKDSIPEEFKNIQSY